MVNICVCVCVGGWGWWRVILQDRSMTMKDGLSFQVSKFEVVKSDSLNFHFSYIWQEYWGVWENTYCLCVCVLFEFLLGWKGATFSMCTFWSSNLFFICGAKTSWHTSCLLGNYMSSEVWTNFILFSSCLQRQLVPGIQVVIPCMTKQAPPPLTTPPPT